MATTTSATSATPPTVAAVALKTMCWWRTPSVTSFTASSDRRFFFAGLAAALKLHSPSKKTSTPAMLAEHWFGYCSPSHPHTGSKTAAHTAGRDTHSPGALASTGHTPSSLFVLYNDGRRVEGKYRGGHERCQTVSRPVVILYSLTSTHPPRNPHC